MVTITNLTILNCVSFRTENLKLLQKQCFCCNSMQCQKLQQVFEVQSFSFDTGPQSFCHSFIAHLWYITLFKISTARYSLLGCIKSLLLLWKPGSNLKKKNFLSYSIENWMISLYQKNISKRRKLMKLCHISRIRSDFLRQCSITRLLLVVVVVVIMKHYQKFQLG